MELRYKLNKTREDRKAAETDAKTMDNRLGLLKLEEDKVLKKIDETKKGIKLLMKL